MTLEKKKTLILCIILVLCLAVLGILISLVAKNALTPADQSEAQYMELPRLQGLSLSEAKKVLTDLNISYEIVHTDDNTINRVLDIEYKGKTENGKDMLEIGTAVKLFANEVGIDKIVYLTFDDGPTYSNTYDILDTLDQYEAKATFFVLGTWAEANPDIMKKIVAHGHEIGNHSYNHTHYTAMAQNDMRSDIDKCNKAIQDTSGISPTLLRAPSGDYNNEVIETTHSAGMEYIQWSVETLDTKMRE